MNILTIETTCDETAAAIVTEELVVRGAVVATQDALHQRFGGVVPEIASRAHVERILPVIDEALRRSGVALGELDAVAVANTPGLAGSLLVGLTAAKALALALDIPLIAVNHLQAHIYACRIAAGENVFPCIGMIVSGGHTSLYRCAGPLDFTLLGGTIDDAAGEAFDKVAAMLGLPFPGGPAIQKAAESGDPRAFDFPRPFWKDAQRLEFSFSGLKTAVRYKLHDLVGEAGSAALSPRQIADLAASFQAAVVDCLCAKAFLAVAKTGWKTLCVGGGVAANAHFRRELERLAATRAVRLIVPPLKLCTDNAVMGAIAVERIKGGLVEGLDLDVFPGLLRERQ
ncbi:MAG TPA: tRNA (adenosine(37)-N6)-threonylcarbamoyltransferase complex transferase subunit TsaD [Pirellulales bacterium]|jgi:N6-L-threonylcarbamoyladenine synthase|nr:tRNA (adenosine(37)-N6)-threonylcarbamoyltransferase complex transferase subunit TsaD [Pirellulales bacterium]